ncbi:unnamed protein product [Arctogadus glacialis]
MGCWALPLVSFLLLLCTSGVRSHTVAGQARGIFLPNLDLLDFHGNPKDRISNEPWFIVVAPNLLRADSPENIYLEAGGLRGQQKVSISIRDYTRSILFYDDTFIMDSEQEGHTLRSIQLPSDLLEPEDLRNRYVYLGVNFHGYHMLEKVIMVSFQQGYIFVQTDKPIYNPGDTVRMRAYVSSSSFKASNSTLMVEFQNPEGVVVKQTILFRAADGVLPESFILSDHANEGVTPSEPSLKFEVKKYVLPAFNVTLVPSSPYLGLDHTRLEVAVSASECISVRVVLMVTEGICSVAFSEQHIQEVDLPAGGTVVVPYTLVPLVVGNLPVQVMVLGQDLMGGDRVEKILRVVLEGVQKTIVRSFVLDPSAHGGTQNIHPGKVELESVVPNSLHIRGSVLADSIDNSISDDSLASLIRMPGGCVEQNLAGITLPLIATLYLDSTHGWESVGVQRRVEAIGYITKGYEKQLAYRKSDGSYPPYRKEGTSTWITAFVVKVFSMAYSLVRVEQQQVCGALLYLLNEKQEHDGGFREDNPVYTTTMTTAIHNAANYLKRELSRPLKRPYTVAISAYALTLLGKDPSYNPITPLLNAVSEGSYWADSESPLFSLEATGYGLLALLEGGHLDEAVKPFNWLNSKRRRGGGYGSTQPTMVVLQALSEYLLKRAVDRNVSLQVDLKVPGRIDLRYHFEPQTSYVARSSRAPLDQEFEVEARGNGRGILELVTFYNQLHEVEEKSLCPHFELEVATEESSETPPADVIKSYQITIRVRALAPRDVRMVVLDISLPTGFTPDNSDLEMLSNSVDHYINNFQVVDNLSDRGSLIIHLFKVSHREPEILIFRLQQNFMVGLLQPSSVTVYEYYNPDHRCSRTYSPPEDKEALSQICRNDVCRCTQGDCCVSKSDSETFAVNNRTTQACESLHYVYKVKVLSVNQSYYDRYEMEITQIIKFGLEPGVADGASRLFMSHGGCRDHLHLQQGSHYFIMGPKADLWQTETGFVYMLGKKTWVERWPSEAECTSDAALQAKCTVLEAAARDLSINGCRQ